MNFKELYPDRVTRGEDGVYRWSYDVDLNWDHYLQNFFLKLMLYILGGTCLVMALVIILAGRPSMAWIPAAIFGVAMVLAVLGFFGFRIAVKDKYTVGYEMNEEAVLLVRKPAMQSAMWGAGLLMLALGAATGKPLRGATSAVAMNNAADSGLTRFRSVRKIRKYPRTDMIKLSMLIGINLVWVPEEDFETVVRFIQEHTGIPARE